MMTTGGAVPDDTGQPVDASERPDSGRSVHTALLADELRQLMSLRSRSSVRDRACPELDRMLDPEERASRDTRYVAMTRLIDDAIVHIVDPDHRFAAAALLGSGAGRWRTVTQRGADAAGAFGCGWDAYRRRRTNGTSQLDDTLRAVAEAMARISRRPPDPTVTRELQPEPQPEVAAVPGAVAVAPISDIRIGPGASDATAPAVVVDDRGNTPSTRVRRQVRPRTAVVLAAVALLATAGAVGLALNRRTTEVVVSNPACNVLDDTVGALPANADAQLRTWAGRFRSFRHTLSGDAVECAGTLERQDGIVVQPVAAANTVGVGAIVAADDPDASPILLHPSEFGNYRRMRDRYGPEMIGTPMGRDDRADVRVVRLTRGTIVGEAGSVTFMVVGAAWHEWTRRGGLEGEMGAPISLSWDHDDSRFQDFEHGRLTVDLVDATGVRWEPVQNPSMLLPPDIADTILKADDGTAWFVDDDLVRRWLPTTTDYGCSTEYASETLIVPAQAIMTLTAGEPFRCR